CVPMMCCILFSTLSLRPPSSPLFPYTTLFRSAGVCEVLDDLVLVPGGPAAVPVFRQRLDIRPLAGDPFPGPGIAVQVNDPHCARSEEHTSELQSRSDLVCRLLLEKKNIVMCQH